MVVWRLEHGVCLITNLTRLVQTGLYLHNSAVISSTLVKAGEV